MKRDLQWHQNCLDNMRSSRGGTQNKINSLNIQLQDLDRRIDFYQDQILSATITKRDGFDRDKYKVKRTSATGSENK